MNPPHNSWKDQSATMTSGIVRVVNHTRLPGTYFLAVTCIKPTLNPSKFSHPGETPPGRMTYNFTIELIVPQAEPSDSTTHTYFFRWDCPDDYIWTYSAATFNTIAKDSRSPIFSYRRLVEDTLFFEPWGTALRSYNNWQYSGSVLAPDPVITGGKARVYGGLNGSSLSIGNFGQPLLRPLDGSTLVVKASIVGGYYPSLTNGGSVSIECLPSSPGQSAASLLTVHRRCLPTLNTGGGAYLWLANSLTGSVSAALAALIGPDTLQCGTGGITVPTPHLQVLRLTAQGGNPPYQGDYTEFGPVTIVSYSLVLQDVSASWRNITLSRKSALPEPN